MLTERKRGPHVYLPSTGCGWRVCEPGTVTLITRYVNRRTESPHEAADVLQAVFQAAADHRDTLPANALPWLIATARHECAQARRPGQPATSGDTHRERTQLIA